MSSSSRNTSKFGIRRRCFSLILFGGITAVLVAAALLSVTVSAQENTTQSIFSGGFENDMASKYVWQGLTLSPGAVMQSTAWITADGLTGFVWSNYNLASEIFGPRMNEVDLTLAYAVNFFRIDIEPSLMLALYPNQSDAPSSSELSVRIGHNIGFLTPFMVHTVEIKEYPGAYFGELGVLSTFDLNDRASLSISGEIGWGTPKFNSTYLGIDKGSMQLAVIGADFSYYLTDFIYVRPHAAMSTLLDNDLKGMVEKPTIYQFGIAAGAEF